MAESKDRLVYERGSGIPGEYDAVVPGKPYYRWGEMWRSGSGERAGLDNRPRDPVVYERLRYLAEKVLVPLREALGPVCINSAYRSRRVNQLVGGAPTSFHAQGSAADIRPCNGNRHSLKEVFEYIYHNLPYTELIAEDGPEGWVHVAIERGRDKEKQLKMKLVGGRVHGATYKEIMNMYNGVRGF